jgi:MoaA/NifB/PqqE/SkfB family radical SAM enzyme
MCTNPDGPWPAWDGNFEYDFETLINRLEKHREKINEAESIYLTGGEPTLHPQFLDILKYLTINFPKQRLKLLTNGRRFIYQNFTKEVLSLTDNFEIDMSLCGPTSEVHDSVTQVKGSFEQATKGLKNLLKNKKKGQIVGIRTVLNKITYQHIPQTLSFLKREAGSLDRIIVIFMEFEAQAIKNIDLIKINYAQVKPYINQTIPFLKDFKEIRFYHFPLCAVDREVWPYVWRTLPASEIDFVDACSTCNYRNFCLGIHKGYLENISKEDFFSIKEEIKIEPSGDSYRPINKAIS